jgi:hypothetical protein
LPQDGEERSAVIAQSDVIGAEHAATGMASSMLKHEQCYQSDNDERMLAWRFASTVEANHMITILR